MPKGIYDRNLNRRKIGWKLSDETKLKMSLSKKGKKPYEITDAIRKRMSESKKGIIAGMLGKHHSLKTKKLLSISHSGSKSHLWKGGTSKLTNLIRNCFKYRQWRSDIFERDNYTCQECGIKCGCGYTVRFEAHHIKALSDIKEDNNILTIEDAINCEELWNINNGITLCLICHKKTDNYKRKIKKN